MKDKCSNCGYEGEGFGEDGICPNCGRFKSVSLFHWGLCEPVYLETEKIN